MKMDGVIRFNPRVNPSPMGSIKSGTITDNKFNVNQIMKYNKMFLFIFSDILIPEFKTYLTAKIINIIL